MSLKTKLFLVFAFFILSIFVSLSTGSDGFSPKDVLIAINSSGIDRIIFLKLRMPRVILGLFVGGGLSVSGVILQALFRNPLTEPYTLGISGGAALGVVFGILLNLGMFIWLPFTGFMGSLFVIMIVYIFSLRKGKINLNNMLLIGVMISFIASSLVLFVMAIASPFRLHGIIFWLMGNLQYVPSTSLIVVAVSSLLVFIVAFLFSMRLNAISLGEEDALHLGVNVETVKKVMFICASLATGVSVAFVGIIGFVGLVVPHFFRIVFSKDHRFLVPLSFFGGGSFLILCDALARSVIAPVELPVGVITGIVGGTTFIYVLIRTKVSLQ